MGLQARAGQRTKIKMTRASPRPDPNQAALTRANEGDRLAGAQSGGPTAMPSYQRGGTLPERGDDAQRLRPRLGGPAGALAYLIPRLERRFGAYMTIFGLRLQLRRKPALAYSIFSGHHQSGSLTDAPRCSLPASRETLPPRRSFHGATQHRTGGATAELLQKKRPVTLGRDSAARCAGRAVRGSPAEPTSLDLAGHPAFYTSANGP
jgi:hypothetical protein